MAWIKNILIGLVLFIVIIIGLGWYLAPSDDPKEAEYIVAISGGDTDARTHKAVELYQEGYSERIIFAGAALDPDSPSNAAVMKRRAIELGVRPAHIRTEEKSQDTIENALNVAELFDPDNQPDTIILVTSPYHQRRAYIVFSRALPETEIINQPAVDDTWRRALWWVNPWGWYLTLSETIKTIYTVGVE